MSKQQWHWFLSEVAELVAEKEKRSITLAGDVRCDDIRRAINELRKLLPIAIYIGEPLPKEPEAEFVIL